MGFGVWGLGFGVFGVGFSVLGFRLWIWGFGFLVLGVGFWVWAFGFRDGRRCVPTSSNSDGRPFNILNLKML